VRAPTTAPEPRTWEQIHDGVVVDCKRYYPKRPLGTCPVNEIAHWHDQFQRHVWTPAEILATRRRCDPLFLKYFSPEYIALYFGTTKPPQPWMLMARTFVIVMLEAGMLDRGSTGVPSYGRATGPKIGFIRQQLVRLMGRDAAPRRETILSKLKEYDLRVREFMQTPIQVASA
jgi:hypothetical protein